MFAFVYYSYSIEQVTQESRALWGEVLSLRRRKRLGVLENNTVQLFNAFK